MRFRRSLGKGRSLIPRPGSEAAGFLLRGTALGVQFLVLACVGLGLLRPEAVKAQPVGEMEELRRKAAALAERIEKLSQEAARLETRRAQLENELALAATRLAQAQTQEQIIAQQLQVTYKRLTELQSAEVRARKDLRRRLGGLVGIKRSVVSWFFVLWEDPHRWVRTMTALLAVVAYQRQQLANFQNQAREQAKLVADLSQKQEALRASREELAQRRAELLATQQRVLAELKRLEAARREEATALSEIQEAQGRLERLWGRVAEGNPVQTGGIALLRGGLPWPAEDARLVRRFGPQRDPRYGTVIAHPGWDLLVSPGAEVKSVAGGRVVFAQFFRLWGNLVIVAHGEDIYTLYGRLATMFVSGGQRVAMGEPLGLAGANDEGSNLYFEVRKGTKALDPAAWLRPLPKR
ncbi:MAG: murein hydrolase activator EnvC family protein [Thermoanaerobaculaceae bacterium]